MKEISESQLYFWLSISGVSVRRQYELLDGYGSPEAVYRAVRDKSSALYGKLPAKESGKLYYASDEAFIRKEYAAVTARETEIITPDSPLYPDSLKQREVSAALALYAKGNTYLLNGGKIAIVGTRRCTDYGAKVARQFSSELAAAGLAVVSGLADGIDTVAHEGALLVGGKTIAVLAGGFDRIYPTSNLSLAKRIAADGLLLSEYRPDEKATRNTFPERNRIISGLSQGVLVVEGGEGSGSLITADLALEQGRELFVVPGRIDSAAAAGTNRLIKSIPHAMVLAPADILKALGLGAFVPKNVEKTSGIRLDYLEEMVYNTLLNGEKHFNAIAAATETDTGTLNTVLFNLELKGLIVKKSGNIYSV